MTCFDICGPVLCISAFFVFFLSHFCVFLWAYSCFFTWFLISLMNHKSPLLPLNQCPDIHRFNIRGIFQKHIPHESWGPTVILSWMLTSIPSSLDSLVCGTYSPCLLCHATHSNLSSQLPFVITHPCSLSLSLSHYNAPALFLQFFHWFVMSLPSLFSSLLPLSATEKLLTKCLNL